MKKLLILALTLVFLASTVSAGYFYFSYSNYDSGYYTGSHYGNYNYYQTYSYPSYAYAYDSYWTFAPD